MEKIIEISEVKSIKLGGQGPMNGKNNSRLGVAQMFNAICGFGSYDGYKIKTTKHEYHLLIENGQSCCESWGYFDSNDNVEEFIGAQLLDVKLTDTAINTQKLEDNVSYLDAGGIQFVDFETDKGVLQIAVYNGHNGYYGHSIVFAKDDQVLLSDTL